MADGVPATGKYFRLQGFVLYYYEHLIIVTCTKA
jgi:hypothetical protein